MPKDTGCPGQIVAAVIFEDAMTGAYERNPFHFIRAEEDYYIESIKVKLDDHIVDEHLSVDGGRSACLSQYNRVMNMLNLDQTNQSIGLTYQIFKDSCFIAVFDLTATLQSNSRILMPAIKSGVVSVTVKFSAPTKEVLRLILFSTHPSAMKINNDLSIAGTFVP